MDIKDLIGPDGELKDPQPDPRKKKKREATPPPRSGREFRVLILLGIVILLLAAAFLVFTTAETHSTASPTPNLAADLLRTQVVLELTQTALAPPPITETPLPSSTPTPLSLPTQTGWQDVGTAATDGSVLHNSATEKSPQALDLALDPQGLPYIIWTDGVIPQRNLYVRYFDGNTWREAGIGAASGQGISEGSAENPVLAVAPDGTLYAAWESYLHTATQIYVKRYDPFRAVWEEVGDHSASGEGINAITSAQANQGIFAQSPTLAVAPDGVVYLAWSQGNAADNQIYVKSFSGTFWREVGAGSANGGGISQHEVGGAFHPCLAINAKGEVLIAWEHNNNNGTIFVRRFNGIAWEDVSAGIPVDDFGYSSYPDLAVAPDDTFYLAWEDDGTSYTNIYLMRLNSESQWEEATPYSAQQGGVTHNTTSNTLLNFPALVAGTADQVYVVWNQSIDNRNQIFAQYSAVGAWQELGRRINSAVDDRFLRPKIALAPDGNLFIAWGDSLGAIYVRRYQVGATP